jgi:very-short-patch-repair endonuclease
MLPVVTGHPLLTAGFPFTLADARAGGLDEAELRRRLRRGELRAVYRGVYVHAAVEDSVELRARSLTRVLPSSMAVSHESAAALWGVDVAPVPGRPEADLTVTVPPSGRAPRWPGVRVVESTLPSDAVRRLAGVRVTSRERTTADLMRERPLVEAVVAADAMTAPWPASLAGLEGVLGGMAGRRGIAVARRALSHVEPLTESPMETRLRMLLVMSGFERPVAQHVVRSGSAFVARVDLAYPGLRLGLEYDGREAHPAGFARDRQRGNALREAGWTVLHFAAEDVGRDAERTVALVRRMLAAQEERRVAGWPGCALQWGAGQQRSVTN